MAEHVNNWRVHGHDVYVYFDNDAKVHAPFDALRLAERLGIDAIQASREINDPSR